MTMTTHQCRRVVTGNTADGKSSVLYDSSMSLLEEDSAASRQEDRAGAASRVIWTTQGFPAENNDPSDAAMRKVNTSESDGTVFRVVEYAPGVTPRKHRTNSIDYAVVMSGSIEVALDNETVKLSAGDTLVQRGTIHNWINRGTDPCVIAFVLIGARPATINGAPLPAVG
jgi:quercetin dioxygenase-like cupin family protein